jgi:pilus assembly protein CpaE
MTPTLRTIIISESASALRTLLAGSSGIQVAGDFKRVAQAVQEGQARRPELVIVELPDDRMDGTDGLPSQVVEALVRAFPEAAVFVTGPSGVSVDIVIQVMRAGAVEFFRRPVQREDFAAALEKLIRLRRAAHQPAARSGRIISVFSTKGGLGVTTIATNLAVCLAEQSHSKTMLIDLDTRQSDVATFLNLHPTYSVVDALENVERLDESFLQGLVLKHASGLNVLAAPTRVERGHIGGDAVQTALEMIRSHYDYVVLDLRHDLDPGTIAALEASDTVLFLTGLTVSALRSGAAGLAAFRHLGLNLQRVKIVIMRDGTGEDVTPKHAQDTLGLPVFWRTPSDYPTVVSAINNGQPVVTASPRSKIAKNLRELVGHLFPKSRPAARGAVSRSASAIGFVWNARGIPGEG